MKCLKSFTNPIRMFESSHCTIDKIEKHEKVISYFPETCSLIIQSIARIIGTDEYVVKVKPLLENTDYSFQIYSSEQFKRRFLHVTVFMNLDIKVYKEVLLAEKRFNGRGTDADIIIPVEDYSEDESENESEETYHEPKSPYENRMFRSVSVYTLTKMLIEAGYLAVYTDKLTFKDMLYDFDSEGNIINRDVLEDKKSFSKNTRVFTDEFLLEELGTSKINLREIKFDTSGLFQVYIPPALSDYIPALVKGWIKFMFSRILPEYHNAFIDLLYSIRYRLISSGRTPVKIYVSYGPNGHEGKSFLHMGISKIFNNLFQVVDKEQLTAEKFNSWRFTKGFISIDEMNKESTEKRSNFGTVLKQCTSSYAGKREMYKEQKQDRNIAIIAMNTNHEQLEGLVYEDKALIDRLVIIHFKDNDVPEDKWEARAELYYNTEAFSYSLWRYLTTNTDGFIHNEGKNYKYSTERYYGEEKYKFISEAKTRTKLISDEFYKLLRYQNSKYNELCNIIKTDENSNVKSKDTVNIIQYFPYERTSYVNYEQALYALTDFINKRKSNTKLKKYDLDDIFLINGWEIVNNVYMDSVKLHGYIYRFSADGDTGTLSSFNAFSDIRSNEIDIKNTLIKSFLERVFPSLYYRGSKFNYVIVKEIHQVLQEININDKLSKEDLKSILVDLGFEEKPSSSTINGSSKYVIKQKDNTNDYSTASAWEVYARKYDLDI